MHHSKHSRLGTKHSVCSVLLLHLLFLSSSSSSWCVVLLIFQQVLSKVFLPLCVYVCVCVRAHLWLLLVRTVFLQLLGVLFLAVGVC